MSIKLEGGRYDEKKDICSTYKNSRDKNKVGRVDYRSNKL
jgi:hypothetical protein